MKRYICDSCGKDMTTSNFFKIGTEFSETELDICKDCFIMLMHYKLKNEDFTRKVMSMLKKNIFDVENNQKEE